MNNLLFLITKIHLQVKYKIYNYKYKSSESNVVQTIFTMFLINTYLPTFNFFKKKINIGNQLSMNTTILLLIGQATEVMFKVN